MRTWLDKLEGARANTLWLLVVDLVVPAVGIIWFDWNAFTVLFLYLIEILVLLIYEWYRTFRLTGWLALGLLALLLLTEGVFFLIFGLMLVVFGSEFTVYEDVHIFRDGLSFSQSATIAGFDLKGFLIYNLQVVLPAIALVIYGKWRGLSNDNVLFPIKSSGKKWVDLFFAYWRIGLLVGGRKVFLLFAFLLGSAFTNIGAQPVVAAVILIFLKTVGDIWVRKSAYERLKSVPVPKTPI